MGSLSRFGTQVNRRVREKIDYFHDVDGDGNDLVSITRIGYETDQCLSTTGLCATAYALGPSDSSFASHVARTQSQTAFDSRSFDLPLNQTYYYPYDTEIYAPLAGASFDRTADRSGAATPVGQSAGRLAGSCRPAWTADGWCSPVRCGHKCR